MNEQKKLYMVEQDGKMWEVNVTGQNFGDLEIQNETDDSPSLRYYRCSPPCTCIEVWEGDHYERGDRDEVISLNKENKNEESWFDSEPLAKKHSEAMMEREAERKIYRGRESDRLAAILAAGLDEKTWHGRYK